MVKKKNPHFVKNWEKRHKGMTWKEYCKAYNKKTDILKGMPVDDLLEFVGYPTTTENTLEEVETHNLDKFIIDNHIVGGEAA